MVGVDGERREKEGQRKEVGERRRKGRGEEKIIKKDKEERRAKGIGEEERSERETGKRRREEESGDELRGEDWV